MYLREHWELIFLQREGDKVLQVLPVEKKVENKAQNRTSISDSRYDADVVRALNGKREMWWGWDAEQLADGHAAVV